MKSCDNPLSRRVLVLNRLWQPVNICGARRAFSLLFKDAAQVVFRDDGIFATYGFNDWQGIEWGDCGGDFVSSVSLRIRVPEIILLARYDELPLKDVKLTRKNVYLRDKNSCQYCGVTFRERDLNLDHVIPRRLGGGTIWTNIVCSCIPCNLRKGEKTPEAAGIKLVRTPKKPHWSPFNRIAFRKGEHSVWEHFLSPALWKVQISEEVGCAR